MKRLTVLLLVLVLTIPLVGWSMVAALKLPDLVRKSEIICIAKVLQSGEIALDPGQISTVKNVLEPTKILKGDWNPREPIVVMTLYGGKAGMPGWLEDQVEFPKKGNHVVLFLEKAEDGSLRTVNTVQGVWPLEEDLKTPLGMGYSISLQDVQQLIEEQK